MFELLIGFFLLASLSLAFREHREQRAAEDIWPSELEPHSNLPQDFDICVYESLPALEEEYIASRHENNEPPDSIVYHSVNPQLGQEQRS
jgi:hypothetical protein